MNTVAQLQARIGSRTDITLVDGKLTIVPAKSTITFPNSIELDRSLKIINNHIESLNKRGGYKIKPL